jgi:hypothetical protein
VAEHIIIPKTDVRMGGPSIEPRPAWFKDEHGFVWLRCECGHILNIDTHNHTHAIGPDGVVTPSLWHDVPECGFHVFGTLDGWQG